MAATASFAQSTVTLYGLVNTGLQSTNGSKTAIADAPDGSNSRWGLRGTEDLGGGLTAGFTLESGFNVNNGTLDGNNDQLFRRQSFMNVGSATLGEVRIGRQYTVAFNGSIGTMPSTATDVAIAVMGGPANGFNGTGSRSSDQIQYRSPKLGGLSAQVSTQLSGNTTSAAAPAAKANELGLAYSNGPLTANFTTASVTSIAGVKTSPMGVNATYNFGVASAIVGYVDSDSATIGKAALAKVLVPFGAHSFYAGFAKNSVTKADAYELGDFYSLSKRTQLYALYANGNATSTRNGKQSWALGVKHAF